MAEPFLVIAPVKLGEGLEGPSGQKLRLQDWSPRGWKVALAAVVSTHFPYLPIRVTEALIDDGSRVVAAIYYGAVQIGDLPPLPADITTVGDEPLLGRGVTDQYRLTFDHGRSLTAEL